MSTLTFLAEYPLWTVILIVAAAMIIILKIIELCKKTWAKREQFKQENIAKGRELERKDEENEERLVHGEARMDNLETDVHDLKEVLARQQKLIELLISSDELDIKSWIKAQHDRCIPLGCIDSQILELLEQRYAIYKKEGGNSWAKKLMDEMRALPTVVNLPISEIHDASYREDR